MQWLCKQIEIIEDFPRPNWEAIYTYVDNELKNADQHKLWCDIARTWVNQIVAVLPEGYDRHESENFILVTAENEKYVTLLLSFLERTLTRILKTLQGIASDAGYGKYVVLVINDIDAYYKYIAYFYHADGVYGQSSGVYLNKGYGHFVFPHQELTYAEAIASHEMTHALLAHLPIPAWLNEGLAVSIEYLITNYIPPRMDLEMHQRHLSFWGQEEIQEFWSGKAFHRYDEGQELSYQLAHLAVQSLSQDRETFTQFVNKANYTDGGESAALEVYGGSLAGLIAQYFGEGDWAPTPDSWWKSNDQDGTAPSVRNTRICYRCVFG